MPTTKATKRPTPEKKRRKPDEERKGLMLRVRITADQRRILQAAADADGLDLSSWLRHLGLKRARELRGEG
jgi:uncharacterized protein (DUF1778 family)